MPTVEKELVIYDLKQQTPGMFPDKSRPPFTADQMRNAVEQFDTNYFKPPCHHGHPRSDATDLALGTAKALSFDGQKLRCKVRVDQAVAEDFQEDRLLGISPEFYRNFEGNKGVVLRGIGFLGATPPRQKGLSMSIFSEDEKGDYDIIVFSDNQEPGEIPMPEPIVAPAVAPAPLAGKNYTDEQIAAIMAKAKTDALAEASKSEEFAEAQKAHEQLKKDNEKLKKDLEVQRAKDLKTDHEAFAESDKMAHATPVQKSCAVTLLGEIESSLGKEHEFEVFAEDGTSVKFSPRELIVGMTKPADKSIQDTLRKPHARSEKTPGSKAGDMDLENFAEHEATPANFDKLVEIFCEKNPDSSKGDAMVWASGVNPEWADEASYEQE